METETKTPDVHVLRAFERSEYLQACLRWEAVNAATIADWKYWTERRKEAGRQMAEIARAAK